MKAKVTKQWVLIPKKLLNGAKEVDIRRKKNLILVVPSPTQDPIYNWAKIRCQPASVTLQKITTNIFIRGNE